ncbi:MAG: hypothetical protein J6Q94_03310 [Clostridia bacterium]|nr:hypothetical protein [Clostridia bacterium]
MAGRNGIDKLTTGLVVIYGALCFIKIFFRYFLIGYIVITVLQYAVLAYAVFRVLSKNLQKRYSENFRFEQFLNAWNPYIEHMKLRLKFFKTHRFRTCKGCGEFLRLKKGKHRKQITCPKCGKELTFHFLF